jgi:SPP1 family predicted phage head-tail adaptor
MARKLTASDLNRRITIQQKQTVVDPEGIPTETWTPVCTVWAAREPLAARAREYFSAAAINAEMTVRYRIRYRQGITPDMRVVDEGRIYNITTVLDDVDGKRRETHLMTQGAQNG